MRFEKTKSLRLNKRVFDMVKAITQDWGINGNEYIRMG